MDGLFRRWKTLQLVEATTFIGGQLKRMTGDVDLATEQPVDLTNVAHRPTPTGSPTATGSPYRP